MTEFEIQRRLYHELSEKGSLWIVPNSCVLGWESDIIAVTKAHVMNEYEIKISKADFRADQHKKKHEHIQDFVAGILAKDVPYGIGVARTYNRATQPPANYFWYVCPEGLIKAEELPHYAGLLWYASGWRMKVIQKAPKLHSNKITEKHVDQMARSMTHRYWRTRLAKPEEPETESEL